MNQAIEQILCENSLLAIIIHSDYSQEGIEFFTPNNYSQQLAYMKHPAGYKIEPHVHNKLQREVFFTQEVLFVKKGKVKVDFYDKRQNYISTKILKTGDIILLASGGHGFEMLEQTEMVEVKQGPYAGDKDKIRFQPKSTKKPK